MYARQRPEPYLKEIYDSSRGILFLGTPHRGSGLAKWGEMFIRVLGLVKQTNSRILKALMRESEFLEDVQDNFYTLIHSRQQEGLPAIQIACFAEELPLPAIGQLVSTLTSPEGVSHMITAGCVPRVCCVARLSYSIYPPKSHEYDEIC